VYLENRTRYFEDVVEGEDLPSLKKDIKMANMMAYGASTWDFVRLHYDFDYARERGFSAPIVDGQMVGGFLAQLIQDWAGPDAFLRKLSFRNRAMSFPGDAVVCSGVVVRSYTEGDDNLVDCDLWVDNQRGERVVDPASATVLLPRRPVA
jgi:acyl dehydratase